MSEAQHTSGPWFARNWLVWSEPTPGDTNVICHLGTNKARRTPEAAANARLIAAAPDLLAACKAAHKFLSTLDELIWPPTLDVMLATAIDKAT